MYFASYDYICSSTMPLSDKARKTAHMLKIRIYNQL